VEVVFDFAVVESAGDEGEDFAFSVGDAGQRAGWSVGWLGVADEFGDESSGDGGGE
jgi:hypothetical protein